jgi:hypothetical protein
MINKLALSTLAAGAAVPAMLLLGTGTVQAATAWAWPGSDPLASRCTSNRLVPGAGVNTPPCPSAGA